MKKRIMSCLVAMSLIASSGSYAFADVRLEADGQRGNTTLRKEVASNFAIIIPEDIPIPDSGVEQGERIPIRSAEGGRLSPNEFVNVRIVNGVESTLVYDDRKGAMVELENDRNNDRTIYSPLRLTAAVRGGTINNPDGGDLYKVNFDTTVACFGPTSPTNGIIAEKGLTGQGYYLYAYRGYESTALDNISDDELVAGTYIGIVTFEIAVEDEAKTIDGQGLAKGYAAV